jgi:hypothetical protein
MKVIAIKDFNLAGEEHAEGEVFDVDKMRGEAWRIAGVVREATPDEIAQFELDPSTKRVIDRYQKEDEDTEE